jgi:hypothetical protein
MADKKATLIIDGKNIELDVLSGTMGPQAIDVSPLAKHGYYTLVSFQQRLVNRKSPTLTVIKEFSCIAAIRLINSLHNRIF